MPSIATTTEYLQQASDRMQQMKLHPHERVRRIQPPKIDLNDSVQLKHSQPAQTLKINQAYIPEATDSDVSGIEICGNHSHCKIGAFLASGFESGSMSSEFSEVDGVFKMLKGVS